MSKNGEEYLKFRCSLYFGLFAILVAGLLSLGQGTPNTILLVGIPVLVGLVYTDWLKWFSLHRFFVYIFMIAGAVVAILQYLNNPGADRLQAVGHLLVYVQLPLIFQVKAKRVFEQWGVFLLLELVVSALINESVAFGVLLIPVFLLGCATLMKLALYTSAIQHSYSRNESIGWLSRGLRWFGVDPILSNRSSGLRVGADSSTSSGQVANYRGLVAWWGVVIPLTACVLIFSVAYFYAIPRTQMGAYSAKEFGSATVGFTDQVSLRQRGNIQQSEAQAFRMSLMQSGTLKEYRPAVPPYIRMLVFSRYLDGPNQGVWQRSDSVNVVHPTTHRNPPAEDELIESLVAASDRVIVSISEKAHFGTSVPSIPPFAKETTPSTFSTMRRDWRMVDTSSEADDEHKRQRRRFSFRTYAFRNGRDLSVVPDLESTLRVNSTSPRNTGLSLNEREELTQFPASLSPIARLRDDWFQRTVNLSRSKYSRAKYLENYLATSPDFKYTLRITAPIDETLDPIADFLLNKRKGHCQYFASSLTMLLRSMNIPTRLVSGFRPSEYNEVGRYFQVQQKHAHVWVEAYFTRADFSDNPTGDVFPEWVENGAWVRLDPTPSGDEATGLDSIKTPGDQAFGMIQELWSELVMNVDRSRQSNLYSLFADTAEESYGKYWERAEELIAQLRGHSWGKPLVSLADWFSWSGMLIAIGVGLMVLGAYKLAHWLFPNSIPRLSLFSRRKQKTTKIEFYNRLTRALRKFDLVRPGWQTPREFLSLAENRLAERGVILPSQILSETFYDLRFGGRSLTDSQASEIQALIERLQR
jgi:protein-glutamine gamma-glutamyltransferase